MLMRSEDGGKTWSRPERLPVDDRPPEAREVLDLDASQPHDLAPRVRHSR